MARQRDKATGRRETGTYSAMPHAVLNAPEWCKLDGWTVKFIMDLLASYRGYNNGDLALTWRQASVRGWRSPGTLAKAKRNAINSGFVIASRQGGRNRCSLYAVSFFAIDECNGKLDIRSTNAPPATWRKQQFLQSSAVPA
jgi:hypothetical protein